jgi:hypothetical protein
MKTIDNIAFDEYFPVTSLRQPLQLQQELIQSATNNQVPQFTPPVEQA